MADRTGPARRAHCAALAVCAALLSCGCTYFGNRARDLHEMFLLDVQLGVGLGVDAKVGPIDAPFGLGTHAPVALGKPTWWSAPQLFVESNSYFPGNLVEGEIRFQHLTKTAGGELLFERESIWGIANLLVFGVQTLLEDPTERQRVARELDPNWRRREERRRSTRVSRREIHVDHWGGVEVGAFAGIAGARVGLNVAELGNFLLGWFGVDYLDDDR